MSGPKAVRQYEGKFAEWFGTGYAFAFWKGRVALYAILKAMGIGNGDEILLPGYTCVMNVNPIKYLGAKPIYVDIEPTRYNIDVTLLRDRISPNTKAIIAQHTYGYPCDMDSVMNIAAKNSIPVIEDCCLALGSRYKGRMVGTFGQAAYFSFQWNKPYTTGLGGMAITSDTDLARRIEELRSSEMCAPSTKEVAMLWAQSVAHKLFVYPRTTALIQRLFRYLTRKGLVVGSSSPCEFAPAMDSDFFKGMSTMQARSGLRQLKKIEQNLAHRKKAVQLYDRLLEQKGWPARKYDSLTMEPVMVRYPVRIAEKDQALAESAAAGVELGSWFECPLHPIETPLAAYDYTEGLCPESEKASREVVNLPLHHRVDEKTARRTVEFITRFTAVA